MNNKTGSTGYESYLRYKKVIDMLTVPRTTNEIAKKTGLVNSTVYYIIQILYKHGAVKIDHFRLPKNSKGNRELVWVMTKKE